MILQPYTWQKLNKIVKKEAQVRKLMYTIIVIKETRKTGAGKMRLSHFSYNMSRNKNIARTSIPTLELTISDIISLAWTSIVIRAHNVLLVSFGSSPRTKAAS